MDAILSTPFRSIFRYQSVAALALIPLVKADLGYSVVPANTDKLEMTFGSNIIKPSIKKRIDAICEMVYCFFIG